MTDHLKLYLFGDQTTDVSSHFQDLLTQRSNPIIDDFLTKAYGAIRYEVYKLSPAVRDALPRFTCVDDLATWQQSSRRCVALDMAVTTIYQLGTFISQADGLYPGVNNARTHGICTGALAAAAVSCSRSTLDLVPLAVGAVIAAFRTGMHVTDVASRVEPSQNADQDSWSMIVPGLASTEAVHKFCLDSNLPLTGQPYISAYAPNGITVSGPPSSLELLSSSEHFDDARFRSIPIFGPYHAPHLSTQDDVENIVKGLTDFVAAIPSNQIPVLSSTGATSEGSNFKCTLQAAVGQILLQPIHWDSVLEELHSCIKQMKPKSFSVVPIATTTEQLIYSSLKQTSLSSLSPPASPLSTSTPTENVERSNPRQPKLAIIGMSGRFPAAKDNEAFWDLLYRGLDVHKPVPTQRWDAKTHVDLTGTRKNTSATPFGCWLEDPAEFDARFFNISPREAPQIDPAQRLALMTAYEAIEQAGIVPDATPSTRRDRVGVFYGVTSNDWMETNSAQNIDTYFIPGGNRAFIPGRINYCFKFSGPSYAVDTACSSSLAGIHIACNSLWRGDIDTAIAGGTNVLTNPDFTSGLDRGHFLSRTGNCKTFDDGADGYCRGEGIGSVIIKRLDDAIADNDPIQAVILGAYTNHSAESESITRPHVGAQRAIFKMILNQGGVGPYDVSYVEMHGTGTQAGDASEMSSVLDTFAPPLDTVKRARGGDEALYLGSAKSNIGHGEAASGVSALIKVLLQMQKNTIVPHCGIKTKINHKFPKDLKERNVNIALEPVRWERNADGKPRRVFVNNFSAAGGNSALLLEDAPLRGELPKDAVDPRSPHVIAVSGKSGSSLQGNLRSLLQYLKQYPQTNLGQLSYTTTARRSHHLHRVMLTGSRTEEICSQIGTALRDAAGMKRPKAAPKVVFTFTGQGAQYPGMGKQLFENFSLFRNEMRHLDQIAQSLGFPSLLPVIQSEEQDISAFTPMAVQLASVCMQIALSRLWASWDVTPLAVVGHSLGEYAALNVAGVLCDSDTVYLVGARARLIQQKCTRETHSMLVAKGSVDAIEGVLKDKKPEISCINSPVETVLAGPNEDIKEYQGQLTEAGIKSTLLKVPYAFHSSQVDPVLNDFKQLAAGVKYKKPQIPILGHECNSVDPDFLTNHTRNPVNMLAALMSARSDGTVTDSTMMLEIGPHPAISGMVKAVLGQQITTLATSQRGRSVWQVLAAALKTLYGAGKDIRWPEYQRDFTTSHKVLELPAYSWDLKEYWIQYVNDWSLRKGDLPVTITQGARPKLESTTIHKTVEESSDAGKTHLVVEADIARKDLSPLVQGHEVDGIPLCTPSVYADQALTVGYYLLKRYCADQKKTMVDVTDMVVSKALILQSKGEPQPLQVHADVHWTTNSALVKFMSFNAKKKLQEHSRCTLRFTDGSLRQTLEKDAANVKQKMQALRSGVASGATALFNRPMVYRMIRPLARFHDDYRAIDEICLNSKTLEASSKLSFGSVKKGGDYHTHPAIIDALTQSCGFTMNCNDNTDLDNEVFMNHGWGGFQIFVPLDFSKEYTTYTRMTEGADKLWKGDVVIFDGDQIVASFKDIAIQGVPRRVLKVILSIESGNPKQQPTKSAPAASAPSKAAPARKKAAPTFTSAPVPAAAPSPPIAPSKADPALLILAEESGIAVEDLNDGIVFADAGIDSLMGLTITARFREEIDLDIDFNALFYEYPSVGDLKRLLGESASTPAPTATPASAPVVALAADLIAAPAIAPAIEAPAPSTFQEAMQIIAEESGLDIEDLTDGTAFCDAGIDSLMGLTISARFKEEIDLDTDMNSLFFDYPTVGDLKGLLGGNSGATAGTGTITPTSTENGTGASTPKSTDTAITDPDETQDLTEQAGRGIIYQRALQIVSEESGVATEELVDDTNFADAGIDSLLSLAVVSRIRDECDVDLQHESFFVECPTVGDLKTLLLGVTPKADVASHVAESKPAPTPTPAPVTELATNTARAKSESEFVSLAARKKAVDELVSKYTAGVSVSSPSLSGKAPSSHEKVVLVTGASGSLGGHLVHHLAQLPDVAKIICLNREHRDDSNARQEKAMRGRGLRLSEDLKRKLQVLQTDSAVIRCGLSQQDYDFLTGAVTHLIHQAWPMSAKRPLAGFESQFQVMRNLIDFACVCSSKRPDSFKFSFQMVSSIGVVGHYGLDNYVKGEQIVVPEERTTIDTVLPNGYGDAKWGCERMLDETLHKHPNQFRTMSVRLGQIAGSRTSGYWNPMEHFGFLVKSSQTLNSLPDLDGGLYWTSVNDIAATLSDLVLRSGKSYPIYHIENPVGQSWKEMTGILADALHIPAENVISFEQWIEKVRTAPQKDNPAKQLLDFLDDNFLRMSCGGLVLDTKKTLEHSKTLKEVGPVSEKTARKYVQIWKEIGFLKATSEDRARSKEIRAELWG